MGNILEKIIVGTGIVVRGSSLKSDFCAPVPFINKKIEGIAVKLQSMGWRFKVDSVKFFENYTFLKFYIVFYLLFLYPNISYFDWF